MQHDVRVERLLAKNSYGIADLLEIMEILRDQCPWDKEQTHQSIRNNFIEEVYEVIEGIDTSDIDLMKEELGDVLLQIVFHSRIEEELGNFDFAQVSDGICKKLITRHPHIFADVVADNTEAVLSNWDQIKRNTKGQKTTHNAMEGVSKALPSLMRAEKVQSKAAKSGYGFGSSSANFKRIRAEIDNLETIINDKRANNEMSNTLGRILFDLCSISRTNEISADEALYGAIEQFIGDFSAAEQNETK